MNREDELHLFLGELEVEEIEVGAEVLLAGGFGNRGDFFLLDEPSQGYLSGALAVGFSYLAKCRVALNISSGERSVGSEQVVHLPRLLQHGMLWFVDVILDLVAED